ncbi:hypothetical protein [Williamwhitmania taraxaci]|uniref:Uncharacterized protein n=1 Tax=Williamwhitmania taraxaci TaxID=1640674 RepID=A0A1G6S0Q4_9BACT|nr:hypothetical protein [Williamwhitmania taraxaci]SDD10251.1 hypothetical protein SAMN05216323_108419 [Williamwhitmania taraxaci]
MEKIKDLKFEGLSSEEMSQIAGGGCRAEAYKMEGSLFKHPKHLCAYNKFNALERLRNLKYEE